MYLPLVYVAQRLAQIIKKHWATLKNNFVSIPAFQVPPIMSYKRAPNLRDRLVKTSVTPALKSRQGFITQANYGSYPCLNCVSCKLMKKGSSFIHPTTNEKIDIRYHLTCVSDWIVYMLWCPCGLLYVGETKNDMRTRLNHHRYTIRKQRLDLPLSKHFSEMKHTEWDLRFMIVDHVPRPKKGGDRLMLLLKKELYWIHRLRTLKPYGLNVEFKISSGMLR